MTAEERGSNRPSGNRSRFRRWIKRSLIGLLVVPVALTLLIAVLVYLPPVQHALGHRIAAMLSKKIGSTVELERLRLSLPLRVTLSGLHVDGPGGDTLLFAERIHADIGLRSLLGGTLRFETVELSGVRAILHQSTDSTFNFEHIVTAFAGPERARGPRDPSGGLEIDARTVHLDRIRFDMELEPSGTAMQVRLGALIASLDTFDLAPLCFHVNELSLRGTSVHLRTSGGTGQPASYPDLTNPIASVDLAFRKVALDSVRFAMSDGPAGDSLWIDLLHGEFRSRSMDHAAQRVDLAAVRVDGLQFGSIMSSEQEDTGTADPPWLHRNDGFRYWTRDWDLSIDTLHASNSGFALHTDSLAAGAGPIDPDHLALSNIEIRAQAVEAHNERISLQLDRLNLRTDPDHGPLDLSVKAVFEPGSVSITDGQLRDGNDRYTGHATIAQGDLSRAYLDPENVPFILNAGGDLEAGGLRSLLERFGMMRAAGPVAVERWRAQVAVSGTARHIKKASITLDGDKGSRIHAGGSIDDTYSFPRTTFDVTVDEFVLGPGLHAIAQSFVPDDVPMPAQLVVRGNARGTPQHLSAEVDLDCDLGSIAGTASVHGWHDGRPDALTIDVEVNDLATSRLIGDVALGPMSFALTANGEQLDAPSRSGALSFEPSLLTYHGNDLSSLRFNASVEGDQVQGTVSCEAPALDARMSARSTWPDAGEGITARWDLLLNALHLDELGLLDHAVRADGRITGTCTVSDRRHGDFHLEAPGLRIFDLEREFPFRTFTAEGLLHGDSSALHLDCDAMRLSYEADLPPDSALWLVRDRLMAAMTGSGARGPAAGRHIDLSVELPGTQRLASLIIPELHALQVDRLEGHYDGDQDVLRADLVVPVLDFDGTVLNDLRFSVTATDTAADGSLRIRRMSRDGLHVDDVSIDAADIPDGLALVLRLHDGDADRYRIGMDLKNGDDGMVLHLHDDLVLDRRAWTADAGNELRSTVDGPMARNMSLRSGDQRVEWLTTGEDAAIVFERFDLSNITGLVRSADSLAFIRGRLDASVHLPGNNAGHLSASAQISDLQVLDAPFGTIHGEFAELDDDRYEGAFTLDAGENRATADVRMHLPPGAPQHIALTSDLDLHDLSVLEPFAQDLFFDLGGSLQGGLRADRTGDDMVLSGRTIFHEGRVGLVQTGAVYRIPHDTIAFDEQGISFAGFDVLDADGNRFRFDGHVLTNAGASTGLDLRLRTDRFQLVNSTVKENPMFYGKLFNSVDLRITGTTTTPVVKGELGVLDSTDLSVVLPGSKVELVDHEGIVRFTADLDAKDTTAARSDSELLRDSLAAQLPGIDLDLRVKLDPRARFAIVLDPTTGDQATFSGDADLVFRYDPEGDIHLQGPFTVTDGGYTLEFYGLVKKRFELVPGGKIIWDGDPLAGRMDIQAKFNTTAAPYPLVANARGGLTESERNTLQVRLPFDVLINFKDAVQAPAISFGLDMDRQVRNSYPQVNSVLEQLAKPANQEELNRQVFGLLVLNTFIENESGTEQGGSSLATTAARNSVNSILTQQLNKVTGNRIKGMDIQLGVNTYEQTEGGENYARTTLDYKVTQRILNDRVSIEAGGSVGADEKRQDVSGVSNTRAPQYAIAYDITKDGRLRLRLYHENAYDLYDGELVNNGVAIMLTRDFEPHQKKRERRRQEILRHRNTEQAIPGQQ